MQLPQQAQQAQQTLLPSRAPRTLPSRPLHSHPLEPTPALSAQTTLYSTPHHLSPLLALAGRAAPRMHL